MLNKNLTEEEEAIKQQVHRFAVDSVIEDGTNDVMALSAARKIIDTYWPQDAADAQKRPESRLFASIRQQPAGPCEGRLRAAAV